MVTMPSKNWAEIWDDSAVFLKQPENKQTNEKWYFHLIEIGSRNAVHTRWASYITVGIVT